MGLLRHRRLILILLFVMALGMRTWRAWQAPLVNPDTIRFIDQAKTFFWEGDPLRAMRAEPYHPLHSLVGGVTYQAVSTLYPEIHSHSLRAASGASRRAWLVAMQTVGVVCGAIVALQIVALSRRLGAPFWAALCAAILWIVGRRTSAYGGDGISDMLCLSLFAAAVLVALPAMPPRPGRPAGRRFFLAGVLAGLAFLTRPEGLAVPLMFAITLALMHLPRLTRRWRPSYSLLQGWFRPSASAAKLRPRRAWSLRGTALAVALMFAGTAIVALPYMLVIGGITNKKAIFDAPPPHLAPAQLAPQAPPQIAPAGGLTMLTNPAAWQKIVMELWETFGFAPFLVNLLAIVIAPHLWGRPRHRLLVIVWAALWVFVMLWLYERSSPSPAQRYLDGRHTLPLLLVAHCWFAMALVVWQRPMRWWQNFWRQRPSWHRLPGWMRWRRWPLAVSVIAALLAALPGIARLGVPPLKDKMYLRDASRWLADHYGRDTLVLGRDHRPAYYAGLPYLMWAGTPDHPNFPAAANQAHRTVLVSYIYQTRKQAVLPAIDGFTLKKQFHSVGSTYDDVLAIYERAAAPE